MRALHSFREGSSAGFEGDGTLANQQKHAAISSTWSSCSTRPAIKRDRLLIEIATLRAELLSTKKTMGNCLLYFSTNERNDWGKQLSFKNNSSFQGTSQGVDLFGCEANWEGLNGHPIRWFHQVHRPSPTGQVRSKRQKKFRNSQLKLHKHSSGVRG